MLTEVQKHIVVFDCNVYLDVAKLVGSPFSMQEFSAIISRELSAPVPHPDRYVDSARALAMVQRGYFVRQGSHREPLAVWYSQHLIDTTRYKACLPRQGRSDYQTTIGDYGLGMCESQAGRVVDDLIVGVANKTGGSFVQVDIPVGNPPLDHEDGMVYAACRKIEGDDPLLKVYCVTNDVGFIESYKQGKLPGGIKVLSPGEFVQLLRLVDSQKLISRPRN